MGQRFSLYRKGFHTICLNVTALWVNILSQLGEQLVHCVRLRTQLLHGWTGGRSRVSNAPA